jgi:hypothetical protein
MALEEQTAVVASRAARLGKKSFSKAGVCAWRAERPRLEFGTSPPVCGGFVIQCLGIVGASLDVSDRIQMPTRELA